MFRARHILIQYQGWWPASRRRLERTKKQAHDIIVQLRLRILSGESFADLASVHSECPSAADGGDLGVFAPGDMEEAFEAALKELEVGEISQVVHTQYGMHLIQRLAI